MCAPSERSLQETYAPSNACFGCGPANTRGLRVRSFASGEEVVAEWTAEPHHEAFPGMLNGGILGTLLDCHSNWTASIAIMDARRDEDAPVCVTAEYAIRLRRPTPVGVPLRLRARVVELADPRATVEAELEAGGEVTATCRGLFVAVPPGHPAHGRW